MSVFSIMFLGQLKNVPSLALMQETEESGEETTLLQIEDSQAAILTSDFPSTSQISKGHKVSEKSLQGFSANLVEAVEGYTSSVYCNSLETGSHEDQPLKKTEGSNIPDETDAIEYLSSSCEEVADLYVPDSQEENDRHDVNESVKSRAAIGGNMNSVNHQIFDLVQNGSLGDDTLVGKKEPLSSESDEREAKRQKLMDAGDQRRRFTRSMSKKACLV